MYYLKTKNGYSLADVMSALQKSIRRGLEKDALYWALEMCPQFEGHLWSRLLIIAYEDISALVPNNIPSTISDMRVDYYYYRANGNSASLLILSNAILLMCRSPKSRVADNFLITMGREIDDGMRLEIPDYAFDKHTQKGKAMGHGGKHFAEIASLLSPEASDIDDPYKEKAIEYLCEEKYKAQCLKWAGEKRKSKQNYKKNPPDPETGKLL